ncbi:hypothetical protein K504DRAFT_489468 [Pleomassaria siparia CBS 279.74]|uniref:Uncharacterized protein n=1 Tax=Pleomassaria siparia CBS 279.74 TaxID=1314801 RepID=A0A6G1KGZ2_9PLEO|nr:hypothetical protein K504DRAFT_489468 [Pleomassaria siparia CBS 279.74]
MVSNMDADSGHEIKDLQHSLRSASLELSLERSKHSVEMVAKDEEIRKLQVSKCLLQDEISDLHEQLEEEQGRADELEEALDEMMLQLDQHKAEGELVQNQFQTQSREVANLKAELRAMENVTSDSNKILSEKLALNREMSSLRPEVEHLRAQVEANIGLLAEKLSLQRQLTTLQVELENEKRTASRALAKQGKKAEKDEELRGELEELRKELIKEKKDKLKADTALAKAEKEAEKVQSNLELQQQAVAKIQADLDAQQQATEKVQAELEAQQQTAAQMQAKFDKASSKEANKASKRVAERESQREAELEELFQELEQEKTLRQKAEKASQKAVDYEAEIAQLREDFEQEKRERQRAEKAIKKGSSQTEPQADAIRQELDEERRERKKAEKEQARVLAELQSRNTVLDEKLSAFREKLRSTKDRLKDAEAKLETAQSAAPMMKGRVKPSIELGGDLAKNARKRAAATVEPETNLGTPGDGFPAKRFKRATSVSAVGDTSTFSLTPFLNRTGSVLPGSPIEEEDDEAPEHESTPTALPKKAPKKIIQSKSKPLAPSASNKANAKPIPRRKKVAAPLLEQVVEEVTEHSIDKDNSENAPITVPIKDADDGISKEKKLVPKIKPRKSLMSFANFTEEPVAEKKKKRKLGATGGSSKTLFDADEDDAPAKPITSKGIFAARALGKSVLGKGRPISGGYNMMSEENFTFSPLKRDRRNANSTLK